MGSADYRRAAPIEAYRAINAVHYAQCLHMRWGRWPAPLLTTMVRNGYRVTPVAIKSKYVIPIGYRAKYAHYPRFAWIAWDRGKPILMMTRYLCGGSSWTARGEDTTEFPVCPKCVIADKGPDVIAECIERNAK